MKTLNVLLITDADYTSRIGFGVFFKIKWHHIRFTSDGTILERYVITVMKLDFYIKSNIRESKSFSSSVKVKSEQTAEEDEVITPHSVKPKHLETGGKKEPKKIIKRARQQIKKEFLQIEITEFGGRKGTCCRTISSSELNLTRATSHFSFETSLWEAKRHNLSIWIKGSEPQ